MTTADHKTMYRRYIIRLGVEDATIGADNARDHANGNPPAAPKSLMVQRSAIASQ